MGPNLNLYFSIHRVLLFYLFLELIIYLAYATTADLQSNSFRLALCVVLYKQD